MTTRVDRQAWVASIPVLLLPAIFVSASVRAEDAPIPIDQPTVITESGSYVVTQDFTAVNENAIRFRGDVTVTIDFAGHTVGSIGATAIFVRDLGDEGCPTVTLRDGVVAGSGYRYGVESWTAFGRCSVAVDLRRMTFYRAHVWVEDGALSVISSRFIDSDMFVDANRGGARGRFDDNEVSGGDIIAWGAIGASIRGNVVDAGSIVVGGSDGLSAVDNVVEDNRITGGDIEIGRWWGGQVSGIVVRHNMISGSIFIDNAVSPWIAENYVTGCGRNGAGISMYFYRRGLIEGNAIVGACDYGITLGELTRQNVYRGNLFKNIKIDAVLDEGEDNVDGGGNRVVTGSVQPRPTK